MHRKTIIYMLLAACAAMLLSGCQSDEQAQAKEAKPQLPKVEIATVEPTPYSRTIELPGRIYPVRVAKVRARVAGIVLSRDFEEGSDVKKGQVLFHIDPAPFQAELAQAKADLAKAEANLHDVGLTAKRYGPLRESGSISQQEYDTAIANLKVAEAEKQAAAAKVKTAALNLSYATVTAPISGRIGRAEITEGSLVGQNEATLLATIKQLDPVYADLTQPVSEFLQLRAAMKKGAAERKKPEVIVEVDEVNYHENGRLLFSDVSVDRTTGQVSLRCEFPNPDGMLLPDMFVRIKIKLGEDEQAILIPQRAVQRAQDGTAQVYVVDEQGMAQVRSITTGKMDGSRWQVLSGLKAGERLVVNGIDKVSPGMQVTAQIGTPKNVAQN